MGKEFMVGDYSGRSDAKFLASMGNSGAVLFFHLTQAVAQHYGLPSGMEDDRGDDSFHMDEAQFRALVIAAFADPIDLLYGWAKYAAGMYDISEGRRHVWTWAPEALPFRLFDAQYYAVSPPPLSEEEMIEHDVSEDVAFVSERGAVLAWMSERRAKLFVSIADACANCWPRFKFGSGLPDAHNGECRVTSERFCLLTEAAVSSNRDWLYPWTRYAVAMYHLIKGEGQTWAWYPHSIPLRIFDPVFLGVKGPPKWNGQYICKTETHAMWIVASNDEESDS